MITNTQISQLRARMIRETEMDLEAGLGGQKAQGPVNAGMAPVIKPDTTGQVGLSFWVVSTGVGKAVASITALAGVAILAATIIR